MQLMYSGFAAPKAKNANLRTNGYMLEYFQEGKTRSRKTQQQLRQVKKEKKQREK